MGSNAIYNDDPTSILEDFRGWRSCWGGFYCFTSRKRAKYRRPPKQLLAAPVTLHNHGEQNSLALDLLNQAALLPPVMCAPPSSPITTLPHSEGSSCRHSPVNMLSLFPSQSGRQYDQMDPVTDESFPLDSVLATPPIFSTLTTEPTSPISTAPFTPPPELAHLTTPPSPEVPFGELLSSSLKIKCSTISDHIGEHFTLKLMPSTNLELVYQVYPCSPIGQVGPSSSGASSSETVSPLPERVCLLESDAAFQQTSSFQGFDHATSSWSFRQLEAAAPKDEYCVPIDPCVDDKSDLLPERSSGCCIGAESSCKEKNKEYFPVVCKKEQSTHESEHITSYSDKALIDTALEHPNYCRETMEIPQQRPKGLTSDQAGSTDIEVLGRGREEGVSVACRIGELHFPHLTLDSCFDEQRTASCSLGIRSWDTGKCCSTCGELTFKCRALSDALQQTEEKLTVIEKRVNLIDEREQKWKQLIHWMQLGAKLQQESIFRLSKELSWQEETLLELQERRLAELGISFSGDSSST